MSMSLSDEKHIKTQLDKQYEDVEQAFPYVEGKGDTLYQKCYDVYNGLDNNPQDWVLEEFRNPEDNFRSKWLWRRKS